MAAAVMSDMSHFATGCLMAAKLCYPPNIRGKEHAFETGNKMLRATVLSLTSVCVCEGGGWRVFTPAMWLVRFWQRVHCGPGQIAFFRFLHLFYIFLSSGAPLAEMANKSAAVSPIKILQNIQVAM